LRRTSERRRKTNLPEDSAAGSNKIVREIRPAAATASAAHARGPIERTRPAASSSTSARGPCAGWPRGQRQGRGGPGRAVGEQRQERRLIAVDGRHQEDDGALVARREREAARAGLDARQRRGERAQTADLDAQARPVRLVGAAAPNARAIRVCRSTSPGHASASGARQREQHRPARQWPPGGAGAQAATAGVDHQRARGEERFDLVEAQRLLVAAWTRRAAG